MSTILIGVDASERSEDAIAFGRRLADVAGAHVVVANAYPYSAVPSRASNAAFREACATTRSRPRGACAPGSSASTTTRR